MLMITRFHSPIHRSEDVLKSTLQDEVNIAIGWFKENHMQANPSQFQAFVTGKCKKNNFTTVGRMLRQSLSLKQSFKIRGNPIVSLRGSFGASWYAETRFIFKPSLK